MYANPERLTKSAHLAEWTCIVKVRALLLWVGLALLLFTATATADGPVSCSFSGTVRVDDAEVAGGTLITAVIGGDEYHTHTAYGSSKYFITIRPAEGKSHRDGTKVVFKVNGHPTEQTATFKAGGSTRLDLTASSKAIVPVSTWLTPLLILLIIALGGIACYFLFRIVAVRRRLAEPVQAIGAGKVVAEPGDRYAWDETKLAWVQRPEPVTGERSQEVSAKSSTGEQQSAVSRSVAKKPAIKRTKAAKFPRRDTSLFRKDT